MFLVDRAVDANGGAKSLFALVLFDPPQHRSQGGCAQAGRARGYDLTDSVCGYTVLLQWTQTQAHQDLVGLLDSVLIPEKQTGCEQCSIHCGQWRGCGRARESLSSSKVPLPGSADYTAVQGSPRPPTPTYTHRGRPGFCRYSFIFHKENLAVPLRVPYKDKIPFLLLHMLSE